MKNASSESSNKLTVIKRVSLALLAILAIVIGVYITVREIRIAIGPHIRFGKTITLIVEPDMNVTYQYVKGICEGKIYDSRFPFDLCADDTQNAVIEYMKENDFVIADGTYEINQGAYFKNGRFVMYGFDREFHSTDGGFVFQQYNIRENEK